MQFPGRPPGVALVSRSARRFAVKQFHQLPIGLPPSVQIFQRSPHPRFHQHLTSSSVAPLVRPTFQKKTDHHFNFNIDLQQNPIGLHPCLVQHFQQTTQPRLHHRDANPSVQKQIDHLEKKCVTLEAKILQLEQNASAVASSTAFVPQASPFHFNADALAFVPQRKSPPDTENASVEKLVDECQRLLQQSMKDCGKTEEAAKPQVEVKPQAKKEVSFKDVAEDHPGAAVSAIIDVYNRAVEEELHSSGSAFGSDGDSVNSSEYDSHDDYELDSDVERMEANFTQEEYRSYLRFQEEPMDLNSQMTHIMNSLVLLPQVKKSVDEIDGKIDRKFQEKIDPQLNALNKRMEELESLE